MADTVTVSDFLDALKLRRKETSQQEPNDSSDQDLQVASSQLLPSSTDKTDVPETKAQKDLNSNFFSLLNRTVPVSSIRAMVVEQFRQDELELKKIQKMLDNAKSAYLEAHRLIPELTLHMATVNKEIETKTVELEELRTEYRDTCQKEERLRRKRDKYCGKYEEMRKRSCYCNDALTIIPKLYDHKSKDNEDQDGEVEDESFEQESISEGDEENPLTPPPDHTPLSEKNEDEIEPEMNSKDVMDSEEVNGIPNMTELPKSPLLTATLLKSPIRKDPPRLLPKSPPADRSDSFKGNMLSEIKSMSASASSSMEPKLSKVSSLIKEQSFTSAASVSSQSQDEDFELEDDGDDGGYMGIPLEDDEEDSSDSDMSGKLVIETVQSTAKSGEESTYEHDYLGEDMEP